MPDLRVIGSSRIGIKNGNRSTEGNARRATYSLADTRGELTDSLAETDIGTRDGLAGDQPFADKLATSGLSANFA
ncbi:MAG: hypothetical protein USCAAHI_01031 [Beijerinckiaceae bacterium]|nr:MAG: hypothetical protein USCAAHI_01031 [Beijerinckiaceae bacterium]